MSCPTNLVGQVLENQIKNPPSSRVF